jgi:hypothetical protein
MLQINEKAEKILFEKIEQCLADLARATLGLVDGVEGFKLKERLKDNKIAECQNKIGEWWRFENEIANTLREIQFYINLIDLLKG